MNLVKSDSTLEVNQTERDRIINVLMLETSVSFELANSIVNFAYSTTKLKLKRAKDIRRDKIFACRSFFSIIKKEVDNVKVSDINDWHQWMLDEGNIKKRLDENQISKGLEEMTIYTRISHLSAYFEWLRKVPEFAHFISSNPVRLAMPKPPKKYNSPKSKSLTDEELSIIWNYLEKLAENEKNKTAIRDYAIFRIFMATGMRREEVLDLSAGDIKFTDDSLHIHALFKGGDYEWRKIKDPETIAAVRRYLSVTGRLSTIGKENRALWIRFDNGASLALSKFRQDLANYEMSKEKQKLQKPIEPRFSSNSFDKQIKRYAHDAGIGHFHIHQFRHTFARIVAEDKGLIETQDALGHGSIETTRQYVNRIQFKQDKHSHRINARRDVNIEVDNFESAE